MSLVLVVDDSPTERYFLSSALEKAGFTVILAESGAEAIEKASEQNPDLIVMDIVMPDMNGFQATRAINRAEATAHIPIVICTTKGQETDKVWALRQGASDYMIKPVQPQDLVETVTRRLRSVSEQQK